QKEQSLAVINGWCSNKTHGKITEILGDIGPEDKMVLLNAIYFKGNWAEKFQKEATKEEDFTLQSGKKTKVKMMHKMAEFRNFRGGNFAAIAAPYVGKKQSMYVFLPDKGVKMADFQSQFTESNWNKWVGLFSVNMVNLSLPKCKMNFNISLKETLKA